MKPLRWPSARFFFIDEEISSLKQPNSKFLLRVDVFLGWLTCHLFPISGKKKIPRKDFVSVFNLLLT